MKFIKKNLIIFLIVLISTSYNSISKSEEEDELLQSIVDQIKVLTKDIKTIEKAVYQKSDITSLPSSSTIKSSGLNEDILTKHLLKLNEIEDQFRELTNKFEEVNFKLDKLSSRVTKIQSDTQLRFSDLETSDTSVKTLKPNLPQYLKGRQAPTVEAKPAELPTSSSTFATKGTPKEPAAEAPVAENLGKEEAVKGAETFGKTVAETEGELVPAEAAEAALPGVGEVLMGLTAAAGLVRGAIKEHKEKKAMEADAPVAPQAPTQQASGIAFSSAPVIDSSDYHHL